MQGPDDTDGGAFEDAVDSLFDDDGEDTESSVNGADE